MVHRLLLPKTEQHLYYWVDEKAGEILRRHGITEPESFDDDDTNRRFRFHDLRSTGLTWMALCGDEHLKIQHRAGHRTFGIAQVYIRTAENLRAWGEAIGTPFPDLPDDLIGRVAGTPPWGRFEPP